MSSLPTIQQAIDDSINDAKMAVIFKQMFPSVSVPYVEIFDIITLLGMTKVNARILPEVIRGIHNLRVADRRGQVIVHIQKDLANVQVRENSETMKTSVDDE